MVTVYSSSASFSSQPESCPHPESLIKRQIQALIDSSATDCCFAVEFTHQAYYLAQPTAISLVALIALSRSSSAIRIYGAILEDGPLVQQQLTELPDTPQSLATFAANNRVPWLCFSEPLRLAPVHIAKPWGQEIWYTGIEARGQSAVTAQGFFTPLPWALGLLPDTLASGRDRSLILLKILDPLAEEVYGDLYFELHEQKQEVYVVTRIDERAWPEGEGAIRLGFAPDLRAQYPDDDAFKQAYLAAVSDYRHIRNKIDQQLDQCRRAAGIDLSAPVDAQTLLVWQQEIPGELRQEELRKRHRMDQFSALQPLRPGDVVKVPCRVPHALQHGVRTVEFQTPVYERKILSFAQKVLTQADWDTQVALDDIVLDEYVPPTLEVLCKTERLLVERVVMFDDFEVQRWYLSANLSTLLDTKEDYALLMLISGNMVIHCNESNQITSDAAAINEAFLLPSGGSDCRLVAGSHGAVVLLAVPRTRSQF